MKTLNSNEFLASLDWQPIGQGNERAVTELRAGESIPDPSSTKRQIHGPATVEFTSWADGGIDAKVQARVCVCVYCGKPSGDKDEHAACVAKSIEEA